MAKESVVVVIPALAVATSGRRWTLIGAAVVASGAGLLLVRALMPVPDGMGEFPWTFRSDLVEFNASRIRFWAAAGLTLLPLTVILWRHRSLEQSDRWILAGTAAGVALLAYSVGSVYADGRPVWMAYPFMVPLAVAVLGRGVLVRR